MTKVSKVTSRESFFNTALESGTRSLVLLASSYPKRFDLSRLVYYDYLLVHSGDVDNGPASLHPESPFRSGEIVARRKIVEKGLDLVFRKGLVAKTFESRGILYAATKSTLAFLDYFESAYANRAKNVAKWVSENFDDYTDDDLQRFINNNIGRWGTEFANDPYIEERVP